MGQHGNSLEAGWPLTDRPDMLRARRHGGMCHSDARWQYDLLVFRHLPVTQSHKISTKHIHTVIIMWLAPCLSILCLTTSGCRTYSEWWKIRFNGPEPGAMQLVWWVVPVSWPYGWRGPRMDQHMQSTHLALVNKHLIIRTVNGSSYARQLAF